MVKKGPCFHCNINSTPIWRNGPAEKPVLCNACGSQFRLWGNLRNYYPKHSQNHSLSNLKNMFSKGTNLKSKGKAPAGTSKIITSGLSPSLWNASSIPSKKRSKVVYKRLTPIEMFQKQLIGWWKYDTKPNEPAPEEVLLMHSSMNNFVPSNEIGLGGMLLKPPNVTSTMKY